MSQEPRRMLAPWIVEEGESTFTVRTANGFVVSVTFWEDEPKREFNLRKEEARRLAVAIIRLPELLAKDGEEMNRYVQPRPYADPDVAARKILEIANSSSPTWTGACWSSWSTGRCCTGKRPRRRNKAGLDCCIEKGWLEMHDSGTLARFTQAGADLFA